MLSADRGDGKTRTVTATMASSEPNRRNVINIHRYTGVVLVPLVFSYLLSLSFIPTLADVRDGGGIRVWIGRVGVLAGVAMTLVLVGIVACSKARFHQQHSILFPLRCSHCADVIGWTGADEDNIHDNAAAVTATSQHMSQSSGEAYPNAGAASSHGRIGARATSDPGVLACHLDTSASGWETSCGMPKELRSLAAATASAPSWLQLPQHEHELPSNEIATTMPIQTVEGAASFPSMQSRKTTHLITAEVHNHSGGFWRNHAEHRRHCFTQLVLIKESDTEIISCLDNAGKPTDFKSVVDSESRGHQRDCDASLAEYRNSAALSESDLRSNDSDCNVRGAAKRSPTREIPNTNEPGINVYETPSASNFTTVTHSTKGYLKTYDPTRNNSLFKALFIFGLFGTFGLLMRFALACICLSADHHPSFVTEEILNLLLPPLIPLSVLASVQYQGLIMVDTTINNLAVSFGCGCCMWFSMVEMLLSVSPNCDQSFMCSWHACAINGTFGRLVDRVGPSLTHAQVGCGAIGVAILYSLKTSMFPRNLIRQSVAPSTVGPRDPQHVKSFRQRIRKWWRTRNSDESETRVLLPNPQSKITSRVNPFLMTTLVLCSLVGFIFCVSNYYINHHKQLSANVQTYTHWYLYMIFTMPQVVLICYQHVITNRSVGIRTKGLPSLSNFLNSGDVILLVSVHGVYVVTFFRLISGIGYFFIPSLLKKEDEVTLATVAIVFSFYAITRIWLLTSFLLVVRRQELTNVKQANWTLVCLIYTGMASFVQWLNDGLRLQIGIIESIFFGDIAGKYINVIFRPVAMTYGLYSAVVAYDGAKIILRKIKIMRDKNSLNY